MGWPRRQWRSLLFAGVLSLAAHVLVLSSWPARPQRTGDARMPVLVVTIARPVAASPKPTSTSETGAPAAPPPARVERAAKESALAPREKGAQALAQPAAPASAPARPRVQAEPRERAYETAETLEQLPHPLSSPELGDVGHRLEGRRLQASVWVDEQGVVRKAFVKRNEISEEVAVLLEHAIAGVRFAPGRKDGQAVPAVIDARLCFDETGVLDTQSEDCLRPAAEPAPESGTPTR